MGDNPYLRLREGGVKVYASTKNKAPIKGIIDVLNSGRLVEVTPDNMTEYLKPGKLRHGHRQ